MHSKSGLIANKIIKDNNEERYKINHCSKITEQTKNKLKWHLIHYLLNFKKDVLEKFIFNSFGEINKQNIIKKNNNLTKEEFKQLIMDNGISNDINLINKMFWLFDDNNNGFINFNELLFGLVLFNDDMILDKKLKGNNNTTNFTNYL